MSTPYEANGRTTQKQRTRAALVEAARAIVASGSSPTVEDAAAATSISRSTAYRYFPNQRALLAAAHPEIDTPSLLPADPPGGALDRLELAVRSFVDLILDTETQQRTMLRLSLGAHPSENADLPLRRGRAIQWFSEALEPARGQLGDDGLRRLVLAIRTVTGIEALVWLTDVGGLSRDEAANLMRWSAASLFRAATDDA